MRIQNLNTTNDYVYDISLNGTVINALGLNVLSNTDGFNFKKPDKFRYTEDNPYIGLGKGRNVKKDKAYTGVEADVAEFEDTYLNQAYNGGILKNGLGLMSSVMPVYNLNAKIIVTLCLMEVLNLLETV